MKIWYKSTLDFDHHPNYRSALDTHLGNVASTDTEIVLEGRANSLGAELDTPDVIGSPVVYHSLVASAFIKSVLQANQSGADAFITASFSEPILTELRSLSLCPVVSMSEASFTAASMNAYKVGMVTLNQMAVPAIRKSITLHKWQDRVSGVLLIDGAAPEAELEANFDKPGPYLDGLISGIRLAIAQGAQAVIPAEGVLAVMAAVNDLTHVDGVPVIDSVGSSLLFAELAVTLKERTGLSHSPLAYPAPSPAARKVLCRIHGIDT